MKTKPIQIGLIQLGDFINVPGEIDSIKRFLNINQKIFRFENVAALSSDEIGMPELDNIYYSDIQLYNLIENKIKNKINQKEIEILFAVTSVRISKKEIFEKYGANDDLDFFSIGGVEKKIGIISVAQWMLYYEEKAYRSTKQYISFNIIPILCEFLVGKGLMHYDFRHCVFDYCWDPNQIISGIKKARISPASRKQLEDVLTNEQIEYCEKILTKIRRPPVYEILRYFQENSTTNLFLLGIIVSTFINFISNFAYFSVGFFFIFLGLIIYQYYRPSGKLG